MLIKLKLENIALIEIIEINFEKGLNVFTGESGSGKSLILDSLNVLFGGTNIPLNHLIRPGKEECLIEGIFNCSPKLNEWFIKKGFTEISSEVSVKRKSYKKNNKILTKYTINTLPISKKLIEELGLLLIDFAGQSDNILFSSHEYRRLIIDDLGSKELHAVNSKVKQYWKELESLKKRIQNYIDSSKKEEENNFAMKQMFKVLKEANLEENDEIFNLESKELKLSNNFELKKNINETINNLQSLTNDNFSVSFLISDSIKKLKKVSQFDSKLDDLFNNLLTIQYDVENLVLSLKEYLDLAENDENSLEDIQSRLFFLKNLERTFSLELPELIKKRDQLKEHIDICTNEEEINKLKRDIINMQNKLESLFHIQSLKRKETANHLQESVIHLLKNLGLENANFSIELEPVNPSAEGSHNVNFLFSANPDQRLAPLSKVISGGEMSRFLLAIKSSISQKPNTFFIDEIDNGLSGKSLFSLVELIKKISYQKQVLCITHQPHLAAAAKAHFKVEKQVLNGLTFTSLSKLNTKKERHHELIELIGGGFNEANNYALTLIERAAA